MLANKAQVGYMSVMPATILCSKPKQAEIKMVATLGMSKGTRCSLVVVRKDAPEFKSNEEVARWLDADHRRPQGQRVRPVPPPFL
ncbi:MAG: hypothetical protein ACLSAH_03555 [Bilophila wadsworthia]